MLIPLSEATQETCGGKAGTLGMLLRAGFAVPDGFVVPLDAHHDTLGNERPDVAVDGPEGPSRAGPAAPLPAALLDGLAHGLAALGDPPVAVRSSASSEDTGEASAAGQHESVLAVQGVDGVAQAVRACWASLHSPRATAYRRGAAHDQPVDAGSMAVLVQRLVDAELSGVVFAPAAPDGVTVIEASWGLGPSVVGGTVTPDSYRVAADGSVGRTVADKRTRLDRRGTGLTLSDVPADGRIRPTLDDETARRLARLGRRVVELLGGAQDIEWAIARGRTWVVQARPVTAALPPMPPMPPMPSATQGTPSPSAHPSHPARPSPAGPPAPRANRLTGTAGSTGTATGTARVVRDPSDFSRVRPGDVLVCPFTDPAWTPLLRIAAGVVTETGGVLSHAAIIARERRIPAVLGIVGATVLILDGSPVTIDGTAGTVTTST